MGHQQFILDQDTMKLLSVAKDPPLSSCFPTTGAPPAIKKNLLDGKGIADTLKSFDLEQAFQMLNQRLSEILPGFWKERSLHLRGSRGELRTKRNAVELSHLTQRRRYLSSRRRPLVISATIEHPQSSPASSDLHSHSSLSSPPQPHLCLHLRQQKADVLTDEVTDLSILLALVTSRRICEGYRFVRSGLWKKGDFNLTTTKSKPEGEQIITTCWHQRHSQIRTPGIPVKETQMS
ncbi:hypothetical protein LguiB_001622 [Lonicera macranthoides]